VCNRFAVVYHVNADDDILHGSINHLPAFHHADDFTELTRCESHYGNIVIMEKPLDSFQTACHFVGVATDAKSYNPEYIGCENERVAGIMLKGFAYHAFEHVHSCAVKSNINHN
jgi:hypothetical protein